MAASVVITVASDTTQALLKQRTQFAGNNKAGAKALSQLFQDLASGQLSGTAYVQSSDALPVAASVTATLTSCSTDTISIFGETLTGAASPANEDEFDTSGGTDTLDAAALASCINAHSVLSELVVATSAVNVVTITLLQKGLIGNYASAVTETGTTIVVANSGVWANGAGGVQDSAVSYALGL